MADFDLDIHNRRIFSYIYVYLSTQKVILSAIFLTILISISSTKKGKKIVISAKAFMQKYNAM